MLFRVNFRRREIEKKHQLRLEREHKSDHDELTRKQKLNDIAASVPYYEAINGAKSDIHRTTLARLNDFYEPSTDSNLNAYQLGIRTGFTDEKLFSDPKFSKSALFCHSII